MTQNMTQNQNRRPDWGKLFSTILTQPGRLSEAYRMFHQYSLGNQALALSQMIERGIPIGPISSFNGWKKLGRVVRKGEKAIALWMPVTKKEVVQREDGTEEEVTKRFFVMKNNWFTLSQTEAIPGQEQEVPVQGKEAPDWDKDLALLNLGITQVAFDEIDGNTMGFARPRKKEIAVNPMCPFPLKTLFHELGHCLLHSEEGGLMVDGGTMSLSIKEAEAEGVALLCCASLGLPGLDECRGYIQHWLRGQKDQAELFLKKSASRVFSAADRILKAGSKPAEEEVGEGAEP